MYILTRLSSMLSHNCVLCSGIRMQIGAAAMFRKIVTLPCQPRNDHWTFLSQCYLCLAAERPFTMLHLFGVFFNIPVVV